MKKVFIIKPVILFFLFLLVVNTVYGQDNIVDEVVWVVGDEAILKSDIEQERTRIQYEGIRMEGNPICIIPEQLAVQKLYLHQAVIDSIEVSEAEVLQRVEMTTNEYLNQIGSREKLEEYFNMSMTQIREHMRENIHQGITVQKMQQKLAGDIKVTPAEVRRYFNSLPADSIPFIPTQVEVQIITMEPRIPLAEIEDVKKRLREYTERVVSGESEFSTLARLYSEDPGSYLRGGELGFMGRAELVPEYANVAFNLQDPNKVSKIVESEFGFHIIQLIEKRGDRINTRHILLKPKVSDEDLIEATNRLDSITNDIRNQKFTFEEAASVLSHDKDTRNNNGLLPNPYTGTSRFELAELSQEIAKVVDKMNVGEISNAFTMINDKGKEVCLIVKLKTKINGHKATITEDYQRLKDILVSKRAEEKLHNWVLEKQKNTYVRISDNWKDCEFQYPGWIK
ncbi:MAG: peptidylprolyl isomerase [Bacteroides sp.]|nr:peptidylprolyl isomerase [Bacteroides sp.]